ncbi:hypothetical protein, partial [Brevundimonas sp. UBA5718]
IRALIGADIATLAPLTAPAPLSIGGQNRLTATARAGAQGPYVVAVSDDATAGMMDDAWLIGAPLL